MSTDEQRAFCEVCGEEFEYKFAFADKHMKKYPFHRIYGTEPKKKISSVYSNNRMD